MSVTSHHPRFDKNIKDKIGYMLELLGAAGHCVRNKNGWDGGCHAIASGGFPSNVNGTHVFVTQVDEIKDASMCIGWTSTPTFDSSRYAYPEYKMMTGCSLWLYKGRMDPGDVPSVPATISKKAKEVVSILTISENGKKITAQWIVDGTEGLVHDVSKDFEKASDQIFPLVVLVDKIQQVQTILFSQLKSTSPKIEELKEELNNPVAPLPSSSSTNNEENEKLIQQLRQDLENAQKRLLEQKDKQIEEMERHHQNELKMKDDQLKMKDENSTSLQHQIEVKDKQLELERAEHQKTRNLLHQSKQEMKDMEIHFLKERNKLLTKESGQRREREDDDFQVKQERSD